MLVIKERFGVIIDVLGEVQHLGDAKITVQAKGLVPQIQSCQFVANLCLFCRILSTMYGVSTALQSSTIDISESGRLITSMITSMSEFRDQPSSWTDIWDDVLKLCSTHDITIQGPRSQAGKRKKTIRESPDYYYTTSTGHREEVVTSEAIHVEFFIPIVDRILSELRRRFSNESLAVVGSVSSVLCPSSLKFQNFANILPLLSVYAEPCGINKTLLEAEMTVALNLLKNDLGDTLNKQSADSFA